MRRCNGVGARGLLACMLHCFESGEVHWLCEWAMRGFWSIRGPESVDEGCGNGLGREEVWRGQELRLDVDSTICCACIAGVR